MTEEKKQTVLVIGAGPAGLYSAGKLAESGKNVVLLNRDIKYGGLAEYGIYVSKHKMKEGIRKQFRKILANPSIEYFGNVTVGKKSSVSLEDIKGLGFDAIMVTVGAQGTKKVGITGEDAKGVFHAKDLVYHYNHLPPFSEKEVEIGKRVAVIGVGNVMVDIAHWLVHTKKVEQAIAIARRGPNERAYTDKEFQAIAYNADVESIKTELDRIKPFLEKVDQDADATFQALTKDCAKPYYEEKSPTKFSFKFLSAPKALITNEKNEVIGLEVDDNELVSKDGKIAAKSLGKTSVIDLDAVIFAIGDTVDSSFGLPVNKWGEFIKNETVYEEDPTANLYELVAPESNKVTEGVFVAGWSRKASDGLVGIAKKDGETCVKYVLKYLEGKNVANENVLSDFSKLIADKNVNFINKNDIEKLEAVEKQEAEKRNLEFYKFDSNNEMLEVLNKLK
ncbi:MAG: FAD-dependent oxidoreductase [Cyanobacteriota bacterium]